MGKYELKKISKKNPILHKKGAQPNHCYIKKIWTLGQVCKVNKMMKRRNQKKRKGKKTYGWLRNLVAAFDIALLACECIAPTSALGE